MKEQTVTTVRAEGRLRKAAESEAIAETRLSRAREEEAARRMEFRAAMSDWGLPDTLSPEGVEEYLRGLATAKESAEQKKAEVAALERVLAEMHVWEAESTAVLAAARAAVAQRAELSEDDFHEGYGDETERLDIESALLALAEACRNERAVRERIAELEGESSRLEDEVSDARTAAEKAEEGLKDLFMRAGVDDEEGFLARHATYERRQELQQAVRLGEETLVKSVGKGEQAEQLRAALATGDVSQWEADLARVRSELDELRFERAEAIKDEGDVERRLSELEVSADVPSLESAFEALQTGLSTAMEEWRVNRLAAHIIGETLTRFTVERQPQVLAEASELFHRVTEGAYVQVRLATEEEGIVVEGIDGQIKYPDQLSRGTAEQLYLCLRLALAEEFARRAEPIPLIMDEVLVNFDSVRRGRMAELLLDFAKRHQILFFTCHESVVELMQGADPSVRTIILS